MIRDLAMAVPREIAVAGTVILALLALTALAAAFADRRPPYAGVVLLALTVAGGALSVAVGGLSHADADMRPCSP